MKALETLFLCIVLLCLLAILAPAMENPGKFASAMHYLQTGQTPQTSPTAQPAAGPYAVQGPPTVTAQFIDQLLCKYGNPGVCGTGADLYNLGVQYGIDPAYPLAFFWNESNFGTEGAAVTTKNLGNLRSSPLEAFESGGFACFYDWQTGYRAWYELIKGPMYVGSGLTTVDRIIPRYAPSADHNSPAHYIAVVESAVSIWRSGEATVP